MREFLFRGKTDSGEWRYGDLRHDANSGLCGIVSEDNAFSYVNPETVCEYTGILAKNGARIFENDIICLTDISKKPRRVMWFDNWGGWHVVSGTGYKDVTYLHTIQKRLISKTWNASVRNCRALANTMPSGLIG